MSSPLINTPEIKLPRLLKKVVAAAERFSQPETELDLCRLAVELARTELGLERVSIYRFREDGHLHGTYGTNDLRETVDEAHVSFLLSPLWYELHFNGNARIKYWVDITSNLTYMDNGRSMTRKQGWVASTLIGHPPYAYGIMFHDCGLSGRAHDPVEHEAVSTYCALLAEALETAGFEPSTQFLRSTPTMPKVAEKTPHPASGFALIRIGPDERILYANELATEIVGGRYPLITGLEIRKLLHSDPLGIDLLALWNHRENDPRARTTISYFNQQIDIDWYIARESSDDGDPNWIMIGADVSHHLARIDDIEEKHRSMDAEYMVRAEQLRKIRDGLEEEIKRRSATEGILHERNYELELLAHSIAHDLRSPLRAINANASLILNEFATPDATFGAYLERIKSNSRKMNDLLDGLAAILRFGRSPEPLGKLHIRSVLDQLMAQLPEASLERIHTDVDGELTFNGYTTALYVMFWNLISNGLKFARPGMLSEVWISAQVMDNAVVFEFRDSGTGIEPNFLKKIHEPLRRGVAEQEFEGVGVGLTVVQRAVALHRGRMRIHSVVGEGTTVTVELPIVGLTAPVVEDLS